MTGMTMPTKAQVDRAADMLMQLRENGNRRPGDNHIDHDIEVQIRARATDLLVLLLNWEEVLEG